MPSKAVAEATSLAGERRSGLRDAVEEDTMSTTVDTKPNGTVKTLGLAVIIAGILMMVAGVTTWFVVQGQLSDQKITVAEDAGFLAGDEVDGPFSAYAEADIINKHALEASDGLTYAELDREDPVRETVMNASFLRASLFTSVVSFGVAAMAAGLGVVLVVIGIALRRLAQTATTVVGEAQASPVSTA